MIRPAYRKQRRNSFTLCVYYFLMGLAYSLLRSSTFLVVEADGKHKWLLNLVSTLFVACLLLCASVWLKNPGFIEKDKTLNFVTLLEQFDPSSLCPECEVIRTPRSRHCNLCGRCIDRFDHHCPWVNNCIGKGNFKEFYTFVFCQLVYLLAVSVLSGLYVKLEFYDDIMQS